jgi:hypothetical protein
MPSIVVMSVAVPMPSLVMPMPMPMPSFAIGVPVLSCVFPTLAVRRAGGRGAGGRREVLGVEFAADSD